MSKFSWLSGSPQSSFLSSDFRSFNYKGSWQRQFINHYLDDGFLNGFDKATQKFADYKDEHLPKSLYKFFPPTIYSLISLENQSLRLSIPNDFNDPFDSYVGVEENSYVKMYLLKALKKKRLITADITNDHISEEEYWRLFNAPSKEENLGFLNTRKKPFGNEWFSIMCEKGNDFYLLLNHLWVCAKEECAQRISTIRKAPFRIACFSNFDDDEELGINTTMWSHYADNHRGFCVKYKLDFSNSPIRSTLKCGLYKVIYLARISKASPRELLKLNYDGDSELEVNVKLEKTIHRALITKSRFWNYEKEWRLIIGKENFKFLKESYIPFPFVDAIYLGCQIDNGLRQHIVQFAGSNNISVYKARKSSEKFKLEFDTEKVRELPSISE